MKLSALLREAVRNICTGTTRFATFGLILSVLAGGLIFADVSAVSQQIDSATKFRGAGAAILTLSAPAQIDGSACQALGDIPGVQTSGALRESNRNIVMTLLPGAPVPEYEVTPGFAALLDASRSQGAGLILSQEATESLGVEAGNSIDTSDGKIRVAATYDYPSDGRRPGFGYAALSITDDRKPFDECWVEAWPQTENLRTLLLTTLMPGAGSSDASTRPSIAQLNSSLGESFSGNSEFFSRITRYAPPLSFALGLSLGFIAIWMRRLQVASALHSGVAKRDLVFLAWMESVSWAFPSAVIAATLAVTLVHSLPSSDGIPLLLAELGIPLAGFCGVSVGALLAAISVRERFLFRFFRDR